MHKQAEGRLHRIGQEKQVLSYYLIADGTLDEKVAEVLVDKTEEISGIFGDTPEGENTAEAIRAFDALRELPAFRDLPILKTTPDIERVPDEHHMGAHTELHTSALGTGSIDDLDMGLDTTAGRVEGVTVPSRQPNRAVTFRLPRGTSLQFLSASPYSTYVAGFSPDDNGWRTHSANSLVFSGGLQCCSQFFSDCHFGGRFQKRHILPVSICHNYANRPYGNGIRLDDLSKSSWT